MQVVIAGSHGFIGSRARPARCGAAVTTSASWSAAPRAARRRSRGTRTRVVLDPDALGRRRRRRQPRGREPGLADRSRRRRKREVLSSRAEHHRPAVPHARRSSTTDRTVLLQASGIGAYGSRGDDVLDEDEPSGTTFFANVVRHWEAATAPAQDAGVRVVHLRTGHRARSARRRARAAAAAAPARASGAGSGSGRQFWPWITLPDEVRAVAHLLDRAGARPGQPGDRAGAQRRGDRRARPRAAPPRGRPRARVRAARGAR